MPARYYHAVVAPAALDRDGFCLAQTTAGAGALLLNGVISVAGLKPDIPRHVGIYSAANLSARTFTVTYLARNGDTVVEALTGPNNSTVETTGNCAQLISVEADGAVGSNVEVGTTGAFETEWVAPDSQDEQISITSTYWVSAGASLEFTQQWTLENIHAIPEPQIIEIFDESELTAKTASIFLSTDGRTKAMRTKFTSFVSGNVRIAHSW